MDQMQYPVSHETLSTWCHVGHRVDFSSIQMYLVLMPSRSNIKWTWTISWLLDQSHKLYITTRVLKLQCKATLSWTFHTCHIIWHEKCYVAKHTYYPLSRSSKRLVIDTKSLLYNIVTFYNKFLKPTLKPIASPLSTISLFLHPIQLQCKIFIQG